MSRDSNKIDVEQCEQHLKCLMNDLILFNTIHKPYIGKRKSFRPFYIWEEFKKAFLS